MKELKILINLCLFQAKPQDFPYSQQWMLVTAILLSTAIFASFPIRERTALALALISIVHVAAYGLAVWGVLRLRSKGERFVQTASAIFGSATLLQFVTWPFVNWLSAVRDTSGAQFPLLAIFALGIWTFAVAVNINRHALELNVGQSILITLGCQIFTAMFVFMLFGAVMI